MEGVAAGVGDTTSLDLSGSGPLGVEAKGSRVPSGPRRDSFSGASGVGRQTQTTMHKFQPSHEPFGRLGGRAPVRVQRLSERSRRRRNGVLLFGAVISSLVMGAGLVQAVTMVDHRTPADVESRKLSTSRITHDDLYLTISGSRGLSPNALASIRLAADRVGLSSTVVHQGTIDLSSIQRSTATVHSVPDRAGIPMSVLAIDPLGAGPTTSSAVAQVTQSGGVIVGTSAAALNRIRTGDVLTLLDWSGSPTRVHVGGVEPDAAIGGAEVMMSIATASTLGLNRPFSVRVWGFSDARAAETVATEFMKIGIGQPIRVRSDRWVPTVDDTIPQAQLKRLLGAFWVRRGRVGTLQVDPSWKAANVVVVDLPIVGRTTCNSIVGRAAADALAELRDRGLASLIHGADSRRYGGCFSARVTRSISGNSGHNLSRHTWGAAIDLNPSENPYGGPSTMDPRVIDAFHRHGFAWGGTFLVPDPMHFEYTGR